MKRSRINVLRNWPRGAFGDFIVQGYECEYDGITAWRLNVFPLNRPERLHHYWVSNGEVRYSRTDPSLADASLKNPFEMDGLVEGLEHAEKEAIKKAISHWNLVQK